ncbi:NADH dehydrogenase subunit J [Roseobacter sp. MED193]|nr:NADH dehydrogenase subunit J [Roseobacter sp. MED193]
MACSLQLSAQDCSVNFIHHALDAPEDWSQGHVLSRGGHSGYHNPSDAWGAVELTLENCATGQNVVVRTSEQREDTTEVFNAADKVEALMNDISSLANANTWVSRLQSQAMNSGAKVRHSGISNTESCGCRVFYPELRGNKEPYKV